MEILVTIITLSLMLILLVKEVFDPLKTFIIIVSIFLMMGAITIDEAVSGFSNKGVLTVAVLN